MNRVACGHMNSGRVTFCRECGKPAARALLAPVYAWFAEGFDTRGHRANVGRRLVELPLAIRDRARTRRART